MSSDLLVPANLCFQTCEEELSARLDDRRAAISGDPFELTPFLQKQRRSSRFEKSLLHHPQRDFHQWKQQAHAYLHEALVLPHSVGKPSDAVLLSRQEFATYIVEEVEISVTPPMRTTATVVIPKNGKTQHPAIVALHSMGGLRLFGREKLLKFAGEPAYLTQYRDDYYSGLALQEELANAGFLSIAIDAFNFGMRTPMAFEAPAEFKHWRNRCTIDQSNDYTYKTAAIGEPEALRALECVGVSLPTLIATDDLRTLDYLATRADVDSTRIGCTGFSFGSFRTHYLSALDERIKAAVSVCWISTLQGIIGYNVLGAMGLFSLPPKLYSQLDMADIVALSAPKPFLGISGWQDRLMQPASIAEAHLYLRNVWKSAGAEHNLGSLVFDTPHQFDAEMQRNALAFLKQHLA